jgi:hypothetical protein
MTHQLELGTRHRSLLEEPIQELHSHEQRLYAELELAMNF